MVWIPSTNSVPRYNKKYKCILSIPTKTPCKGLTYWSWDKIDEILHPAFWHAFSRMKIQVQVFYFPNRSTWYNLQSVCSSFLEGGRTEKHSLSSCPSKYKNTNAWILWTIDISQSNIKWYWKQHEKEESESSKTKTRNSETTHHTSPFRASRGVSPLSSLQRIHSEVSRVHCTLSWKTDYCIFVKMSLKFAPKSPINNVPVLVQILD